MSKGSESSLKGLPLSKCDNINVKINMTTWTVPGGPVVRTPCFHCRRAGFSPAQETKIPQTTQYRQKEK